MKKNILLFILFAFGVSFSMQAQIKWNSVSEAISIQKRVNKPIFLDVYTVWCGPCKVLDSQVFSDPTFADFINKNYIPAKFNGEGDEVIQFMGRKYTNPGYNETRKHTRNSVHEFSLAIGVRAYPSMFVIEPSGKISKSIMGGRSVQDLITELNR